MRTLPPFARRARAAITGGLALAIVAVFSVSPVAAQISDAAVAADSDLVLQEEAGSGAYQHYTISLSIRSGQAVLTTNKDGVAQQFVASGADAAALWQTILKNGLETLQDAATQDGVDASQFSVKYRVNQTTGGFAAFGVDSLSDGRYRAIVRAILALASRYAGTRG